MLVIHFIFMKSCSYRFRQNLDKLYDFYQELDFLVEAKNSVKCMDNFRKLSPHIADYVYAPRIYWNLSTSKLLTMEYMEAAQVNDLKSIQRLGIQPSDVVKLVSCLLPHTDIM